MPRLKPRGRAVTGIIAACAAASLAVVLAQDVTPAQHDAIVVGHGADRLPNSTASDWVTYADHVVAATATSEEERPPTQQEIDSGEGLIGREVTMKVDEVVWSRQGAPRSAPTTWKRSAMGWQFTGGDTNNRVKMARAEGPRIEAGHTYIIALVWEEDPCTPGTGKWFGLGGGSTIPYDDAVIGQGEMEGREQTAAEARQILADGGPGIGLEEKMAGKTTTALAQALKSATPQANPQFTKTPDGSECG